MPVGNLQATLEHIATIQTGVFGKPVAKGDIVYLQARHFDEFGQLISTLHSDLKSNDLSIKHILQPGDVLFAAKGSKNFAAVFEDHNPKSVASTSFFIIRLFDKNILPEYLALFINHPSTQNFLKGTAIGTSMVSISKAVLEKLEIPIPDLKVQRLIINITQLSHIEKKLKQKIETLREKQIQQQIINAIK